MEEIKINDTFSTKINFKDYESKELTLNGMIQNLRNLAWGGFLILRTPDYHIQTVYDRNSINVDPDELRVESAVKITGTVKAAKIKDKSIFPQDFEVQVTKIEVLSTPSVNPLPLDTTKKELNAGLDTKFDLRPLTLRHPKQQAVFKIAAVIYNEFGNFLAENGFTRICSPKMVSSGAEGGANIFDLEYFGRKAYLAQSPQFYKQMMVGAFGRVYETAPVFRAEKHDTSRHLNEYVSLDFEMMLENGFIDIIQVESGMLRHVLAKLAEKCSKEIALLDIELPVLNKIVMIPFQEVHEIIFEKYKKDFRGEKDLAPEEENLIGQYAKEKYNTDFVFVTHYPSAKRPFYTMDDPNHPDQTLSFDLIFRGVEITTGGQRLHKYEDYLSKMEKMNLNPQDFKGYLQAFQFGMPAHGGLGFGLERFTALICGLANVKEASLFPRDINRLDP
ncbi:MAG: aspartate--tRNA(Asn) ligase [Spirochaetes bacterium]|nr:aspartate--tRNA(Asn) ligase [Spirochaetota bacterium]